ncbi:MAG: RNase H family protein [Bacteroidia bacterium]|nr:hypothetical protein [Bacteroidia bacterium]MDW8134622.1 RNase H family protein [Bacteroidia bacterium]
MYQDRGIEIDVDGAWLPDGRVKYGVIIRREGKEIYREFGEVPEGESHFKAHRQVGGEIYAVIRALSWCAQNEIAHCTIYYDYEGLAKWANGTWKARTPLTEYYVNFLRNTPTHIDWVKVPAHKGLYWNELTDKLAREGE